MSNVVSITGNTPVTMSSREIAKLTGKAHLNVLRDVRKMLQDLGKDELSFESIYLDSYKREKPCFNLPRDLTETLITGYSTTLRHKVVCRLRELEAEVAKPQALALPDFTNPAVAARAWASEFEGRVLALEVVKVHELKIAEDAPKVQFHDDVTDATNTQTIQEVAKVLQMGPNKLFQFLRDNNILMEEPRPCVKSASPANPRRSRLKAVCFYDPNLFHLPVKGRSRTARSKIRTKLATCH